MKKVYVIYAKKILPEELPLWLYGHDHGFCLPTNEMDISFKTIASFNKAKKWFKKNKIKIKTEMYKE